mmetsp:Transcript_77888/g.252505  ORF Transcript_77888/g.252505 Transcript_77888/m.252505 type:complete len:331 (+) Transcript_77888:985-1977(+)
MRVVLIGDGEEHVQQDEPKDDDKTVGEHVVLPLGHLLYLRVVVGPQEQLEARQHAVPHGPKAGTPNAEKMMTHGNKAREQNHDDDDAPKEIVERSPEGREQDLHVLVYMQVLQNAEHNQDRVESAHAHEDAVLETHNVEGGQDLVVRAPTALATLPQGIVEGPLGEEELARRGDLREGHIEPRRNQHEGQQRRDQVQEGPRVKPSVHHHRPEHVDDALLRGRVAVGLLSVVGHLIDDCPGTPTQAQTQKVRVQEHDHDLKDDPVPKGQCIEAAPDNVGQDVLVDGATGLKLEDDGYVGECFCIAVVHHEVCGNQRSLVVDERALRHVVQH